ncbi:MAG: hypothetical protein CL846_08030 [Crocinitomicaceae bacterium]|nr:hypothetical protein [Crocinitomicaceae bacterium]|tara:strand:- start:4651 stop:4884 length:234 start_codon:yes stop_codon:yes gene_type:complete
MDKIKLIWDFRGSTDLQVATHYTKHIVEFLEEKNIKFFDVGGQSISEFHQLAFVIINKEDIDLVKYVLKPSRAKMLK